MSVGVVGDVIGVEIQYLCNAEDLPCPEEEISLEGAFQRLKDEEEQELIDLEAREVKGSLFKQYGQEHLMKIDTVQKGHHCCSENGHVWIVFKQIQIPMAMQVLMHWSIPFPCILVKARRIPKVLIELAIGESAQLRIEIGAEIKHKEEDREVQSQYWNVPAGKSIPRKSGFVEDACQGDEHLLHKLVDHKLRKC